MGVGNGVTAKRHERNLIIDMLYIIVVVMIAQIYTIIKTLHIIYLKWVYFIILKLYLNKVYFKSAVENVRERKDIGCREGRTFRGCISRNYNGTYSPAILCS